MASLWNKLTFSSKTSSPPNDEGARPKRTRKQSLSARSRKSLSLIFPQIFEEQSDDKENVPAKDDVNCEEASHYPIYDPENPDHNTAYHSPSRRSRSWSPLKEQIQKGKRSLRSKSPSPTRMMKSSLNALNELANSVKATAAVMRPSTPPKLLRDMSPMGRDSEKSVKSKKSVHWRSSDSTTFVTSIEGKTSPKDISKEFSPILPDIGYSDHFLGSKLALTARPPPTPMLKALEQADQRPHSTELQCPVLAEITQPPLLTPMPGTNLPLEDPFDDAAAIPEREIKIFEDAEYASEQDASAAPAIEVIMGFAPSSIATLAVSECLDPHSNYRASSNTYDADNDSTASEDSDANINALARVHPRPPNMEEPRVSSVKDQNMSHAAQDSQAAVPRIQVFSPTDENGASGRLGLLQATSEASSSISLGSALDDSDRENQHHRHGPVSSQYTSNEHATCAQSCRITYLSEPLKHDVSPPDSPPRQPPVAHLTLARRLPTFHLRASVTSTSPPRDSAAFPPTNSSNESMSLADEADYTWYSRNGALSVNNVRTRTPSPANVPLPNTPLTGTF